MNYYHDGYYSNAEEAARAIERLARENWQIVAVLPPMATTPGASVVVKHATRKVPSWETTDRESPPQNTSSSSTATSSDPFADLLKKAQPYVSLVAELFKEPK